MRNISQVNPSFLFYRYFLFTDNVRTIQYKYNTGNGLYHVKTMTLLMELVKKYNENDPVEVLFDPARHEWSVLKFER